MVLSIAFSRNVVAMSVKSLSSMLLMNSKTESTYGSTVSVSKMNEWAEILDDALAFLGD